MDKTKFSETKSNHRNRYLSTKEAAVTINCETVNVKRNKFRDLKQNSKWSKLLYYLIDEKDE